MRRACLVVARFWLVVVWLQFHFGCPCFLSCRVGATARKPSRHSATGGCRFLRARLVSRARRVQMQLLGYRHGLDTSNCFSFRLPGTMRDSVRRCAIRVATKPTFCNSLDLGVSSASPLLWAHVIACCTRVHEHPAQSPSVYTSGRYGITCNLNFHVQHGSSRSGRCVK